MASKRGYLIDTHCWLWWHIEPSKLSRKVIELVEDGSTTIFFSVVSAWEIVIKYRLQKLRLPLNPYEYIPKRLEISYMDVLPVQLEHTLQVENLPDHHKDPFDRLLIAQAISEKLNLISSDCQMSSYDVEIVW
ncbi:type II toxin-antitoxin system VapC family toxin [Desulfosarcina ovata]|uniref:Twitching motility protein PilT n=2 Tax=Desulfosarcina ovata TaxID=83564 RepID=A0A5K8A5B1_9BACT|nr:type II toxin-antitoxin system VapC family toxin [Desulfosarcina ovata]BBO80295.1 twitching motility protein PilT [Desulfosarcina ovata subsp. sediminis]BBO87685.1 twitching motility protein PilT [Desulfosarcina ovata subsp. ovata]